MQNNKIFDADGLLSQHPEWKDRLKWWTVKLCQEQPQTFDIVLAVRFPFSNP
jgi:NAD+ kinase